MSDTPSTLWTHTAGGGSLTPGEVATLFAALFFTDGPRRALPAVGHCIPGALGGWAWQGEFRLVEGRHTYGLSYDGEVWRVWVAVNGCEGKSNG